MSWSLTFSAVTLADYQARCVHDWLVGLRMLQMDVHPHLFTCAAAIPLLLRTATAGGTRGLVIEVTDGTRRPTRSSGAVWLLL